MEYFQASKRARTGFFAGHISETAYAPTKATINSEIRGPITGTISPLIKIRSSVEWSSSLLTIPFSSVIPNNFIGSVQADFQPVYGNRSTTFKQTIDIYFSSTGDYANDKAFLMAQVSAVILSGSYSKFN